MDLNTRFIGCQAGADLQHMGAERVFISCFQVIGIILHKRGSAIAAFAHGFHNGRHSSDLPVTFAAVAVALCHQVLRSKARQLFHTVQILEGVGEGHAALIIHHLFDSNFFSCLIANRFHIIGGNIILFRIHSHHFINLCLGNGIHGLHQLAHRPSVDLPAQFDLNFHLVAFRNSNFTHIVTEAHDFHVLRHSHADGSFHPVTQSLLDGFILPIPGDDLPRHSQPGGDEAVLPVAVGGLIQVHKVHVDLIVGDPQVILGSQVAIGLLQIYQAVDPHFGG